MALALLGLLLQLVAPDYVRWRQRLVGVARGLALTVAGLSFEIDSGCLSWQVVADGDGDGLSRADLQSGVDRALAPPVRLRRRYPGLQAGRPRATPPLLRGSPGLGGVAFGRSRLLSCSPTGSTSSGTLYLHNSYGEAVAVRAYGPTGRLTLWWWAGNGSEWAQIL